jgi:hypothetical protein
MTALARQQTVEAAADSFIPDRSIEDLDIEICRLARQLNAETYRFLMLVRDFDDRYGFAKWSLRSCAEWLAWRCGMTSSTAREKLRTAHALRGLPVISAAFADGRLSYSKVRALTRAADAANEDLLLAYALDATAEQVEERCRQIRNVAPESTDVARRAWERRSLTVSRNPTRGTLSILVELPVEDGEVVANALDDAVAAGDVATGIEFAADRELAGNGWRAQQADALVSIAKAYLAGGRTGDQAGSVEDHHQVVAHVDATALRGGAGRSDLPLETIKRLTCDGSLITVVEDERGTPLDVGCKQRVVSTSIRRALWSRDRGCTFPGCRNKRFVHGHHIHHWANGGETSLENLTLLCAHHHRLLHEGGFSIDRDRDGAIYFRRADGRVIPRGGYRLEDMLDDMPGLSLAANNPSAEGFRSATGQNPSAEGLMAAIVHGRRDVAEALMVELARHENPSAEGWVARERRDDSPGEVRESAAVYRIDRRAAWAAQPIFERTSISSGKNTMSSAFFKNFTPDVPPEPVFEPMMRSTVFM